MSLDISLNQKENGVYVVSLTGSIDNSTRPSLDDQIEQLFKLKASTIVLDMEDLKFMSSVGVGLVNRTKNRIKEQGGHFAMVNLQPQIKKVFDIMSLLPTMNVFNDDQELDEYLDKIQHRITEDGTSLGS
ncbi:MAG: STAS domain-containing protein [Planctomycetes bacterium]|nr:STAS domain-containing protein [Planctomycetota bacterium]